jgi:membrane protein DedA with SNARE-associated domain
VTWLVLATATLISEDLACITAGLLIQQGRISVPAGIGGCAVGILAGDLALWALGRGFGSAALRWSWLARRLEGDRWSELGRWLQRHAAGAIVGSRFLPGTRVPLYVTAGVLRMPFGVFASWSTIAVGLWTPTLVLLTASFGERFVRAVAPVVGSGTTTRLLVVAIAVAVLQAARRLASPPVWRRVTARLARWSRWEFWPMWLFYAPVAAWIVWLAIRHRGISTITAANPGIADGGTVGESKFAILDRLPRAWAISSRLVRPGPPDVRVHQLMTQVRDAGWTFPLVLKPDVGQRGIGVKLVADLASAARYLSTVRAAVIAQPYHAGPYEAGVFYYRMPGARHGRILSITDKHFPVIVGDGIHTIEDLIWGHPRYRMQARTFLTRHSQVASRVLADGEPFSLALAGNHAQGTLFRDGSHLFTPALERRIDEIARSYEGFFVGRFDIRYRNVEAFKAGRDLAIVELNGATAESTDIYDPDRSILQAYRQLFRQWSLVFAIGAANRSRGAAVTSRGRLLALVRAHLRADVACPVSD